MKHAPALVATLWVGLLWLAAHSLFAASVPDADHTFYGLPTDNDELLETGEVTVRLAGGQAVLARDVLGSFPEHGGRYVLRVPLELGFGPPSADAARPGDAVELYIGDTLAGVGQVGAPGEATALDLDRQYGHPPTIWVSPTDVIEGNAGTTLGEVVVQLSRRVANDVHFTSSTVDGTAIHGEDYVSSVQSWVIPAGETSIVLPVAVIGETVAEPTETFSVVLSDLTGAVFRAQPDGSQALVHILADDVAWIASVEDGEALEGNGDHTASAQVTVVAGIPTRTSPIVNVGWELVAGTATAGSDFVLAAGTLAVDTSASCPGVGSPCGQIPIGILGDQRREGDETLSVRLTSTSTGEIGRAEATFTVVDDEHYLQYRGVERSNPPTVRGLASPVAAAVTTENAVYSHVVVASDLEDTVSVFNRDVATGALSFVEAVRDGDTIDATLGGSATVAGLDGVSALAIVADSDVYAAGLLADAVVKFTIDLQGHLSLHGVVRDGQGGVSGLDGVAAVVATDHGGDHIYTAARNANAVAHFRRDSALGLSYANKVSEGAGASKIRGACALALYPDFDNTYLFVAAATDSSLTVFRRDLPTGNLIAGDVERDGVNDASDAGPVVDGLGGARAVAVSPDRATVYVAGELDDAVAVFAFDALSGELTFLERKRNGSNGVVGLERPSAVTVQPDGRFVFVASRGGAAVTVFRRAANGRLTWFETRSNGDLEAMPDTRVDGLAGAAALTFTPHGQFWQPGTLDNLYVVGQSDAALATFEPVSGAPVPPTLVSTTHTANTWSTLPQIRFEWSGAQAAGIGLSGYAYVVDGSPATDPALPIQQPQGSDPHAYTTSTLADGVWYFHLRTCDAIDQCAATQHLGPFGIDTVDPLAPTDLVKTNPPEDKIDVSWTAAVDPGAQASGLAGYVHAFSQSATASCDGPITLPAAAVATSSGPLADGFWYFHICAVDQAGLRSPLASLGPLIADSGASLKVTHVTAVAPPADGEVDGREVLSGTQLRLDLNRPVAETGVGNAYDLGHYQLVSLGTDGVLDTTDCAGAGGDDARREVLAAHWVPVSNRLYLQLDGSLALPAGKHALLVCDSLRDFVGRPFDGDADNVDGGTFIRAFEVLTTNLLVNPNLDQGATGWTLSPAADITAQDADAHEAPTSGSLRLENNSGGAGAVLRVSQCLPLDVSDSYGLSAQARVDDSDGGQVLVGATVQFFDEVDCSGQPVATTFVSNTINGDTAGAWQRLELSNISPLASRAKVSFAVTVGPEAGQSWVGVDVDELTFVRMPTLFRSGFELGSTGEWSGVSP